jgi:hypothetical protein
MNDYTGIIAFRKSLRYNCRTEVLRGILRNKPALYPNVTSLELKCRETPILLYQLVTMGIQHHSSLRQLRLLARLLS